MTDTTHPLPDTGRRVCAGCHHEFLRTTTWQRWCSTACRVRAFRRAAQQTPPAPETPAC